MLPLYEKSDFQTWLDVLRSARGWLALREVRVTLVQAVARGHLQRARISDELQAHLRYVIASRLSDSGGRKRRLRRLRQKILGLHALPAGFSDMA